MSKNDRYVVKHGKDWAVKKAGAERASGIFGTQAEAEAAAKRIVGNSGGGEVRIQAVTATSVTLDTVAPGNDPFPPRDSKH